MSDFFFSIIVPTYNRIHLLEKCILSILKAREALSVPAEIIVTSDSYEDTRRLNSLFDIQDLILVAGPGKGPAANRNRGAKEATGEWLVFFDDDIIVDPMILVSYYKAICGNPGTLAFEGAIVPDNYALLKKDMAECPVNLKGESFWSANICVQRHLFWKVEGFDEQFFLAAQEDQDLALRLKKHSQVVFLSESMVVHPVRFPSLRKKLANLFPSITNWYLFEKKHHLQTPGRILILTGSLYKNYALNGIKSLASGSWKSSIYYFSFMLLGIPFFLKMAIKNRG